MTRKLTAPAMSKCILCYSCMIACARVNYRSHSVTRCALKIKTAGGMSGKYAADICRSCERPTCAYVCPTGAMAAKEGGGARLIKSKCIGCRKCVDACKINYLHFDDELKLPLMCTHCGVCVKFCPHGCISISAGAGVKDGEL